MTNLDYENKRLLEVVTEDDEVVGAQTRTEVHRLGLLHREVHVWMFDKDFNIIFQKRGLHARSAGLLDATAGGHVNQGEDYLEAAVREMEEETGISIATSDLILLGKLRGLEDKEKNLGLKINNFIRSVYIYKSPVNFQKIIKESGIPGGGFQKISKELLLKHDNIEVFMPFVFREEIPLVLKYIK